MDRAGALSVHRAQAVRPRVPPAQDHHALVTRGDEVRVRDVVPLAAPVLEREELHREVDALELPPGDGQVARLARAPGQEQRVVILAETLGIDVDPHVGPGHELHPLGPHLVEAPVERALLHLELGDPVPEEPADPVGALEHGDLVASAAELLRGGQPGRPGAHHGDPLPGADRRRLGRDPAFGESPVDDRELDRLDRHRVVVDPEDARALARGGAQRPRELREVVRGVQAVDRLPPVVPVDEVVPVGNQVPERTPLVAEGDAAVHAPRRLRL